MSRRQICVLALSLALAWSTGLVWGQENQIINSEFDDGLNNWGRYGATGFNVSVVQDARLSGANAVLIDVTDAAATASIGIAQSGFLLEPGKTYPLGFTARTQQPREMVVLVQTNINNANWPNQIEQRVNLTPTAENYLIEYTHTGNTLGDDATESVALYLMLKGQWWPMEGDDLNTKVWIDRVYFGAEPPLPRRDLPTNPDPAEGTTDVWRDADLAWSPGAFAQTHDVYFGASFDDVNNASRTNPLGVLVSEAQSDATYDPGRLQLDTTYYWRIDEVNAPPDSTIVRGPVWSFTTEPVAYVVENVTATSNAVTQAGGVPENTVNGSGLNADDQHSTTPADMWLGMAPEAEAPWIQYEFDRIYALHEMLLWNYNTEFEMVLGFGIKDATVEYSADGAEWTALGDVELARATAEPTYTHNTTIDFGGAAARFVRLTVNRGWGTLGQYGLSEVRFLYIPVQASRPTPADGDIEVDVPTALTWRPGRQAAAHEVYFDTDPNALADGVAPAATVTDNRYVPEAQFGTTYYWRVDEVNDAEPTPSWAGDVWSFTTQAYEVVDDFESYTDDIDAGETIFDTWLDGYVNDTGSMVGHFESPFAEQTIVRSGRQSMPLYYDNTAAAYSETTVKLADLQVGPDWTRHGIQALALHFYGNPDNAAEQMYVKINDSKILYEGGADDLKQTLWRPWSVDLEGLNVDLRSVTELSIGFERVGATGGKGVVYFDDIRLAPATSVSGAFSIYPWTGDQDSRISSDKGYTHTGKFSGEGVDGEPFFAGNNVHFERDTNGSGTNWTLTGPATNVFDTTNPVNVTDDSAALVRGFFYGDQDDNHPVLTLTGLVPGTAYVTTFYTVGYGGAGGRFTDVTPGDNPRNPTRIDQNGAGSGNGQLIVYRYIATNDEMNFTFDALVTGDSWHHYAFSNEVAGADQTGE